MAGAWAAGFFVSPASRVRVFLCCSLVGGVIAGVLTDRPWATSVCGGILVAQLSLYGPEAVSPDLAPSSISAAAVDKAFGPLYQPLPARDPNSCGAG